MGIKTIYIARHGYNAAWDRKNETEDSEEFDEESILIPPTGIPGDSPLSPHGILQSKELAHYLLSLDTQPDLVVSSPYYRCVETAYYVSNLLDVPLYTDRGLGEWFDYTNNDASMLGGTPSFRSRDTEIHPPSDVETLNKLFINNIKSTWKDCIDPYTDEMVEKRGETKDEMFARTRQFLHVLDRQVSEEIPDAENILLLTHAPIKISLGLNLLGFKTVTEVASNNDDITLIRSGCCSLDKYELEEGATSGKNTVNNDDNETRSLLDSKWRITMNGNTVFLRNGEEMAWDINNIIDPVVSKHWGDHIEQEQEREQEQETETIYVSLDLNSGFYKDRMTIDKSSTFQYSGLNQERPLFRIGNKLYEGEWRRLVGTELAFPNEAVLHKRNRNLTTANPDGGAEEDEDDEERDEEGQKPANDNLNILQEQSSAQTKEFNEYNLNIDPDRHGEVIYRIKDRLSLTGLHPV